MRLFRSIPNKLEGDTFVSAVAVEVPVVDDALGAGLVPIHTYITSKVVRQIRVQVTAIAPKEGSRIMNLFPLDEEMAASLDWTVFSKSSSATSSILNWEASTWYGVKE